MTNSIKYEHSHIHQSCADRKLRIKQRQERSKQKSYRDEIKNFIKYFDDAIFPRRK